MSAPAMSDTAAFRTFAVIVALAMAITAALGLVVIRWDHFGQAFALGGRDIGLVLSLAVSMILSLRLAGSVFGPVGGVLAPWLWVALLLGFARLAPWLVTALVAAGVVAGLSGLVRNRDLPARDLAAALVLGGLLGAMHLMLLVRMGYAHPLAMEAALHGLQHRDTLFHAAIVSSLRAGEAASLSLDGTVPISYHVFSHRIVAALADWLSVPSLNAYSLFVPILSGPVLVGTFLWSAGLLVAPPRQELGPARAQAGLTGLVLLAGVAGASNMWASESFMVGLWAVVGAAAAMHAATLPRSRWAVLLLPAFVVIAGMAKISVGAVLACGVAAFVAHHGRWRIPALLGAVVAGPVPFLALSLSEGPDAPSDGGLISPFAFLFGMPESAVLLLLFAVVLTVAAFRAWPEDRARRSIAFGLGATLLSGVCAAFLVDLPAGAQLYFINPGIVAGMLLVPALGLAPRWMLRGPARRTAGLVAAGVVVVILVEAQPLEGLARLRDLSASLDAPPPLAPMMTAAASADAVHFAAGSSAVWQLSSVCWTSAFAVQAIAGKPLLMGLPSERNGCAPSPYYGFADYDPSRSAARPLDDGALCTAARQRGYDRILVVGTRLELRHLDCDGT
jgi:hypothetical protein